VQKVKDLYKELKLEELYHNYEEEQKKTFEAEAEAKKKALEAEVEEKKKSFDFEKLHQKRVMEAEIAEKKKVLEAEIEKKALELEFIAVQNDQASTGSLSKLTGEDGTFVSELTGQVYREEEMQDDNKCGLEFTRDGCTINCLGDTSEDTDDILTSFLKWFMGNEEGSCGSSFWETESGGSMDGNSYKENRALHKKKKKKAKKGQM